MPGPMDLNAQSLALKIRQAAADIANHQALIYLQNYTDGRRRIESIFQVGEWDKQSGPFVLELMEPQVQLLNSEDKEKMYQIASDATIKAMSKNKEALGRLMVGYAKQGQNFFTEFK